MAEGARLTGLVPLLQVFDMVAARAFYIDLLGFAVHHAAPEVETAEGRFSHWMWLRRDDVSVMLNTAYDSNERPAAVDGARWAGHGDVCLYLGCSDIDAFHAGLAARGMKLDPPAATPHGMRQLTLTDPDGYLICVQAPA
ncbi:VOC family protein [Sphingomonas sp.]|uniref:VOC family protein n=1 Tax=Sphingomonas sp. TaxID=28214 RepID=UPI001D73735B|nr:VOC family protein [Sphingomonas sp.]MBX9797514.1 VOC family protein [Sphingomonas sp.]